ncbi:MAG: NUDIX domain-containing protein [Actinobacteria bacterium]|nr:NUDIX domain-containing protein [Actinomycetota bacterium]
MSGVGRERFEQRWGGGVVGIGAADVARLVGAVDVPDALAVRHREQALEWLSGTEDVFRREKPATPAPHLVSYVVPTDPSTGRVLLVRHRRAGLWLPPGGHVEPGEHPADAARREVVEELAVGRPRLLDDGRPRFLTWNLTVGPDEHVDVSLWFRLDLADGTVPAWDAAEISAARWWSAEQVRAAPAEGFDRHLPRFLASVEG